MGTDPSADPGVVSEDRAVALPPLGECGDSYSKLGGAILSAKMQGCLSNGSITAWTDYDKIKLRHLPDTLEHIGKRKYVGPS